MNIKPFSIEDVARVCHEVNRQYCLRHGEYEMLNTKYPDDPAINCVFHPSSTDCNPDGSRKGETAKVSN